MEGLDLDEFILRSDEDSENWTAKTKKLFNLHRSLSVKNIEIIDLVQSNMETILTNNRGLNRLREIERNEEDDKDFHKRRLTKKIEGGVMYHQIFTDGTLISNLSL